MKPVRVLLALALCSVTVVLVARPMALMESDANLTVDRQALLEPAAIESVWASAGENLNRRDRTRWMQFAENFQPSESALLVRLLEEAEYMGSPNLPPSSRVTLMPHEVTRLEALVARLTPRQRALLRTAVRGAFDHGGVIRSSPTSSPAVSPTVNAKPRPSAVLPTPTPQPAVTAR